MTKNIGERFELLLAEEVESKLSVLLQMGNALEGVPINEDVTSLWADLRASRGDPRKRAVLFQIGLTFVHDMFPRVQDGAIVQGTGTALTVFERITAALPDRM